MVQILIHNFAFLRPLVERFAPLPQNKQAWIIITLLMYFSHHITHNTFSNPWGMAFDLAGNLHVVDHNNNTVSIFTPEGKYISQYNSQVQNPSGIAIDEEGYKFIGEYHSNSSYNYNRLSILGPENNMVHTIQAFNRVSGVAMDKDGYVYVCSYNTSQVLKY